MMNFKSMMSPNPARMARRSAAFALTGAICLLAAAVIVACGGSDDGDATATPEPTATPTPLTDAPLDRIIVPAAGVDAPIVVKGLDSNRVMQSPDNASDVAWYDFTSRPGAGSNAVFSGHVDFINVGPAVFWNLNQLKTGDVIEVRYADGVSVRYAVTEMNTFDAASAPVDEIVGPTDKDSVTLITCTGDFNRVTGEYGDRLIVRAEKV